MRSAPLAGLLLPAVLVATAGAQPAPRPLPPEPPSTAPAAQITIERRPTQPTPPFDFNLSDQEFLDDVQYGAFRYFWETADPKTGLIADRTGRPETASVAGVGFNLAALPVGVERNWVTREQAHNRALLILNSLLRDPRIRHAGLYQHFIDTDTAGPHHDRNLEQVVSTVDSALLFCGVMVASSYFGGDVAARADQLLAAADWSAFAASAERTPDVAPAARGFISLGYKVDNVLDPADQHRGTLLPYLWLDSGCEHRLVTFLAVAAATPAQRVDPALYYKLRRQLGEGFQYNPQGQPIERTGPLVWFPYSGALFVNVFSHLFLDYAGLGPADTSAPGADRPRDFNVDHRARVDWWENSRRMTLLHRWAAIRNPERKPTLGANAWGLTASDYPGGYQIPGVFPKPFPMPGAQPDLDFSTFSPKNDYGDGTIAPYGPGCAILFEPTAALAALRYAHSLKDAQGNPLAWRDPRGPKPENAFGFVDSFNLKGPDGQPWSAPEYVAIDQGPLLIAIENARSGLIWKLFHQHPLVAPALDRLHLRLFRKWAPAKTSDQR